jgi:16S rRNA (cytosine967-C5)-methyltransferase
MRKQDQVTDFIRKKNARLVAVRILTRVEKEGAYANLLLRAQLNDMEDGRDRHLATTLVNGVLKNKTLLDYALRKHLAKAMSSLPHEVRASLRVGALQILFLAKIPDPVAINETVNVVKVMSPGYTALVNSVLRKTSETGWNFPWPDKNKDLRRYLALKYSHPEWLINRWLTRWGPEETEQLLSINNYPAPTCIRTNTLRTTRENLKQVLSGEGIRAEESLKTPEALYIEDFGTMDQSEAFRQGLFTVQDESSQLVAHVLKPQPGDRVLDVCSAPGGKTTHFAQFMNNEGEIVAVDLYPQKIKQIEELAERLGIEIIHTLTGDARELEGVNGRFDCVLVDAPCSGLGVIRRRADLRWQKREDEIKKLPELQLAMLTKASEYVLPGGKLVYSTCTTEPEENFEIVKAFRRLKPEFTPVDLTAALPFPVTEERDLAQLKKGVWQILPHRHGMDGFFLAKFRYDF